MSPFPYALSHINFSIPQEMLRNIYQQKNDFGIKPESIDAVIEREVLRGRVLTDLNVKHGITMMVDLASASATITDDGFSYIYDIPSKLLEGRRIINVISIHYMDQIRLASYGQPGINQSTALNRVSRALVDSHNNIPATETSAMEVIGDNTVLVRYGQIPRNNMVMFCTVSNDENLNNFHSGILPLFSQLCTEAVKADIYNKASIRMDRSEMINGVSIGKFREIADSYADAYKNYTDLLSRMNKALILNDLPVKQMLFNFVFGRPRR